MPYQTLNIFFDYHPGAEITLWRSDSDTWHIKLKSGNNQLVARALTPLSVYDTLLIMLRKGEWNAQDAL